MTNIANKTKTDIREELNADIQNFLQRRAIEVVRAQRAPKHPHRLFKSQQHGAFNPMSG